VVSTIAGKAVTVNGGETPPAHSVEYAFIGRKPTWIAINGRRCKAVRIEAGERRDARAQWQWQRYVKCQILQDLDAPPFVECGDTLWASLGYSTIPSAVTVMMTVTSVCRSYEIGEFPLLSLEMILDGKQPEQK
jgi:hypothetical protein